MHQDITHPEFRVMHGNSTLQYYKNDEDENLKRNKSN